MASFRIWSITTLNGIRPVTSGNAIAKIHTAEGFVDAIAGISDVVLQTSCLM